MAPHSVNTRHHDALPRPQAQERTRPEQSARPLPSYLPKYLNATPAQIHIDENKALRKAHILQYTGKEIVSHTRKGAFLNDAPRYSAN